MSDIKDYIIENLRLSLAAWGAGSRVGSLVGALIALGLAIFALVGGAAAGLVIPTNYIPLLLGVWFLFLVLIVTPFRMWQARGVTIGERDKTIVDLQAQTATKTASQEKLNKLWRVRDAGIKLRNMRLQPSSVLGWTADVNKWREEALAAAEDVSPNLRAHLETLDQTRPLPQGVNPVSREHGMVLNVVSEIVARIGEYQKRHT